MLVVYEAENSVSWVHGYTRTYTTHEIEEGRIIEKGEEAGLVCRDNNEIRSFIIGHNGISKQEKQLVQLWVSNIDGETLKTEFELQELKPFETFKIYPRDYINNLTDFLKNQPGNCAIAYKLSGGFTRLVVGNETIKGDEFQVLHSNFNYSRHYPGYVGNDIGYYSFPFTNNMKNKQPIWIHFVQKENMK